MRTSFPTTLLEDPHMKESESIIRKCVHCGFCTATCPTYTLLGDELDSPRGRIYLIKEMLENERKPTVQDVKHIDRCLSCLSCMTTCPSGVNYMHLVDHARQYIEDNYERPVLDRAYRWVLSNILPYEGRFRSALMFGWPVRFIAPWIKRIRALRPIAAMLELIPSQLEGPRADPVARLAPTKGRVALLGGCAEPALKPGYRAATMRLLHRMGYETVTPHSVGCCGAMTHHLGREAQTLKFIKTNVDHWYREYEQSGLEAIVITASGCGTTIKDYGFILKDDPEYAERAKAVSKLAVDVTEFIAERDLPDLVSGRSHVRVAYHSACSMQHGQQIKTQPIELLRKAGFDVATPVNSHLCCGSAGVYNVLQSEIAEQLGAQKAQTLADIKPDLIASGNVGCSVQIARYSDLPIVHTIELLDWATGGPQPSEIEDK